MVTLSLAFSLAPTVAAPHVRTLGAVAAELSSAMGRPVVVDRALGGVPLLVDEPGASAAQRLGDVAFALRASVVREGDGVRIVRSSQDRDVLRGLHKAWLQARIEHGLSAREAMLRRSAALGDEKAQVGAATETLGRVRRELEHAKETGQRFSLPPNLINPPWLNPVGRLVVAVARRVGPSVLADLPPNGVRFFSDRPNGAESRLPKCDDLLAEYDRRAAEAFEEGTKQRRRRAKLILRADEFGIGLQIFDAQGRRDDIGVTNYANLVILGVDASRWGGPDAVWRPLDDRARAMWPLLKEDPDARVAGLTKGYEARGFVVPPVPALPEPLLHPESDDPLDLAVRDGVLAMRPRTGGMVAVLADWTLPLANARVRDGKLDVAAFERGLFEEGIDEHAPFERTTRGGTTVLRPADPLGAEAALADRAALGKAVRRVVADRSLTLLNWPAVSWSLYPSRFSPVKERYLRALMEAGLRYPDGLTDLDPPTLALLGAALQERPSTLDLSASPYRGVLRDRILQYGWLKSSAAPGVSELDLSPSSLLASGLLDRARLDLGWNELPLMDMGGDGTRAFTGGWIVAPLYPDIGPPPSEERTRELFAAKYLRPRYRLGRRLELTAEIRLGDLKEPIGITDSVLDRTGIGFDQLPEANRDYVMVAVRKALERQGVPVPTFLGGKGAGSG